MADTIIILVVVVILIFALKGSIRHFRGEGACCGGGENEKSEKEDARRTCDRTAHDPYFRNALPELCQQCDECA